MALMSSPAPSPLHLSKYCAFCSPMVPMLPSSTRDDRHFRFKDGFGVVMILSRRASKWPFSGSKLTWVPLGSYLYHLRVTADSIHWGSMCSSKTPLEKRRPRRRLFDSEEDTMGLLLHDAQHHVCAGMSHSCGGGDIIWCGFRVCFFFSPSSGTVEFLEFDTDHRSPAVRQDIWNSTSITDLLAAVQQEYIPEPTLPDLLQDSFVARRTLLIKARSFPIMKPG